MYKKMTMHTINKIGIIILFLVGFSRVDAQNLTKYELSIQSGIEHSFINYNSTEIYPSTSGWRTAQEMSGNFNMSNSIGLNINTRKKLQIKSGITFSNPSFDAIDAYLIHTVSPGALTMGILPYSEIIDYRIKFRFFHLNLGIGLLIEVSKRLLFTPVILAKFKFLADYKHKVKESYETWNEIEYFQKNAFAFIDFPIFAVSTSLEFRYQLNKNNPNGIDLKCGLNYSHDFSYLSSWINDFLLSSVGFNAGIIIPIQNNED